MPTSQVRTDDRGKGPAAGERREDGLLHQVGGGLRVLHAQDGEPEEAIPVMIHPGFGVEGRCIVHCLNLSE
jgi:hypothetical protein